MLNYSHDEWALMGMVCPPMFIVFGIVKGIHVVGITLMNSRVAVTTF